MGGGVPLSGKHVMETMYRESRRHIPEVIFGLCRISGCSLRGVEIAPYPFLLLSPFGAYLVHCIGVSQQQPALQVLCQDIVLRVGVIVSIVRLSSPSVEKR